VLTPLPPLLRHHHHLALVVLVLALAVLVLLLVLVLPPQLTKEAMATGPRRRTASRNRSFLCLGCSPRKSDFLASHRPNRLVDSYWLHSHFRSHRVLMLPLLLFLYVRVSLRACIRTRGRVCGAGPALLAVVNGLPALIRDVR
jgi:hypothetical protein